MGQVKESKRGRYYWITGKYRGRLARLLLHMAEGVLCGVLFVFACEKVIFRESSQPWPLDILKEFLRQIYIYFIAFSACEAGIKGLVSLKIPKATEQIKALGKTVVDVAPEMAEGVKELGISMGGAAIDAAVLGPTGGAMLGVAGTLPAVAKIGKTYAKFIGKVFNTGRIRVPYWLVLCVPFFLVYFLLMIIPELIVGTFSDEVVETLDKTVIVISILCWIVGIVWCVGHFFL